MPLNRGGMLPFWIKLESCNVRFPAVSIKSAKSAFQWDDPFLLNDQLSDEERMIADAARAFAADKLLPRVTNAYLNEVRRPRDFLGDGAGGPARRHHSGSSMAGPRPATCPTAWWRARSNGSIPATAR
jgi:hypothetical protein